MTTDILHQAIVAKSIVFEIQLLIWNKENMMSIVLRTVSFMIPNKFVTDSLLLCAVPILVARCHYI